MVSTTAAGRINTAYDHHFFEAHKRGVEESASRVVPELLKILSPRSVVDVGCGLGVWLAEFRAHGITDLLGIDGDHVDREMLSIEPRLFVARDLRQPLAVDRKFDLAISLEVAEHLPPESAAGFVGELVKLAPLVVFSAAIPFQGGTNHLNEQWPDYWARIFSKFRYVPLDCIRSRIWNDDQIEWWYRQNIILYASRSYIETNPQPKFVADQQPSSVWPLVHPKLYALKIELLDGPFDLGTLLRKLPSAARSALRNRFGFVGRSNDPSEAQRRCP